MVEHVIMTFQSLPGRNDDAADGEQDRTERLIAARVNERLFSGAPIALRIGRFTVLEELGRGGMGLVYSAHDEQLDRKVAIKVLLDEASSSDAQRRFLREGQAMARITHVNVVNVHEVGTSHGQPFLAMELIRGQSLSMWLRSQPGWREVLEVFIQAGRGLIAAHQADLVHCDLKLNNIMRGDDGVVKILDFGIARSMDGVHANSHDGNATSEGAPASGSASSFAAPVTQEGMVEGTPLYMAPEQLSGGNIDARTDQFSFCVALYEALYGERPFHGMSVEDLMQAIIKGSIRSAPRGSKVPAVVRKAVLRGLAHDPAKRWSSMEALLELLQRQLAPRRSWVRVGVALSLLVTGSSLLDLQYAGVWDEEHRQRGEKAEEAADLRKVVLGAAVAAAAVGPPPPTARSPRECAPPTCPGP
jgi:eukaryotic-like serine/threonine-protein kinase